MLFNPCPSWRRFFRMNLQNESSYSPRRFELLKLQLERLKRDPPLPGKRHITFAAAANHTFSRGTVHAVSSDPTVHPEFDPHYLGKRLTLLEMVKFVRKFPEMSPSEEALGKGLEEYNRAPVIKTDEQLLAWIKKCLGFTFHPAGTCSMLPWEQGGVVSPELKVYGTKNIRVVDSSIWPVHSAPHLQASVRNR